MDGIEGQFVRWKQHDEWEVLGKGGEKNLTGYYVLLAWVIWMYRIGGGVSIA